MKFAFWKIKQGQFRGQWRWHLVAANTKIVANGGESYHNLSDMVDILEEVFKGAYLQEALKVAIREAMLSKS